LRKYKIRFKCSSFPIIILLLVVGFFPWYFSSWINGDLNCPVFRFETAVLSVLCVMFLVELSFVMQLLNVWLAWLPKFLNLCFYFSGFSFNWYNHIHLIFHIRCIFIYKLFVFCILVSFLFLFRELLLLLFLILIIIIIIIIIVILRTMI